MVVFEHGLGERDLDLRALGGERAAIDDCIVGLAVQAPEELPATYPRFVRTPYLMGLSKVPSVRVPRNTS
jgi:hypothetical protein